MNDAKPSKSARKREHLALQELGENLIPLEPADLAKMPLGQQLLDAILLAKSTRSRSASRRQRQLIGKLMRDADAEAIRSSLHSLNTQARLDRDAFREAEQWRDRICAEGTAAAMEFAQQYVLAHAPLEKLWRELDAAKNEPAKRSIRRRIFREVHTGLTAAGQRDIND